MIYLASPYSHPDPSVREERFQAVCRYAAECMRNGEYVLSPIAHGHPIAQHGTPTDWGFWQAHGLALLATCDEVRVLMLPGWEDSVGVSSEIAAASVPVSYVNP